MWMDIWVNHSNFYYDLLYICWLTKPYEAISFMNKERVNNSQPSQ